MEQLVEFVLEVVYSGESVFAIENLILGGIGLLKLSDLFSDCFFVRE
jgi:hypothetical protein